MNEWSDWRDWEPSRPLPVEGGIAARSKRGAIGETWWSQRFIELLESFDVGSRLARGRNYARRGQVVELEVEPGVVLAKVQGSRFTPYRVRIRGKALTEQQWRRVEKAMAARALPLAKLLAGEMPHDIEDAFAACKLTLFPRSNAELKASCTCPDSENPCKHVAAAYYILAERFDEDPFLIFAWRGRDKDELLKRLRARRGTGPPARRPLRVRPNRSRALSRSPTSSTASGAAAPRSPISTSARSRARPQTHFFANSALHRWKLPVRTSPRYSRPRTRSWLRRPSSERSNKNRHRPHSLQGTRLDRRIERGSRRPG